MASSIFGNRRGTSIDNAIRTVRSMGSPQAAYDYLARSGAVCTLPDGRQVNIQQFAQMMQGKSPDQAFRENGINPNQMMNRM